jgi:hypothetical protein
MLAGTFLGTYLPHAAVRYATKNRLRHVPPSRSKQAAKDRINLSATPR